MAYPQVKSVQSNILPTDAKNAIGVGIAATGIFIAGFRALIGELFPNRLLPSPLSYQICRTLLGTYIAPIGDGPCVLRLVDRRRKEKGVSKNENLIGS